MAGIPDFAFRQVERWCAERVPAAVRDQVRVRCARRGRSVTIVEQRPPWRSEPGAEWVEQKIAQLRLDETGTWSVRWADRDGRWLSYPGAPTAESPVPLLEEIDRNPNGVFWG
ncbi:DUF3024 domain-containing protein [Amycolatopsis sp. 195334CR]|uniref:DUF3024 domain-containing protein n=1 Tax=Amycolatopsis sp. 195334CR TaxID=2814588 RepID=UPI001A8DAAF8|nr:DUF3024 domain-containing protein [Amycolatopsis sp. 195334CR]MBN6034625.1 DUF3024 domain-containing protein [Amycolatopsis sp. 195334CR]